MSLFFNLWILFSCLLLGGSKIACSYSQVQHLTVSLLEKNRVLYASLTSLNSSHSLLACTCHIGGSLSPRSLLSAPPVMRNITLATSICPSQAVRNAATFPFEIPSWLRVRVRDLQEGGSKNVCYSCATAWLFATYINHDLPCWLLGRLHPTLRVLNAQKAVDDFHKWKIAGLSSELAMQWMNLCFRQSITFVLN